MGGRRRNIFVLLWCSGCCVASALVIASQADRPGARPQGRHGARLPGAPDAADPRRSTPDAIDRAIEIIRREPTSSASPSPRSRASAATGIRSGCPNVQNAGQAIEQVGKTAQLYFYDLEANIIPNPQQKGAPKDPTKHAGPEPEHLRVPGPLRRRSSSPRSRSRSARSNSARRPGRPTTCSTSGRTSLLVRPGREAQAICFLPLKNGSSRPDSVSSPFPRARLVAARRSPASTPRVKELADSAAVRAKDRPAL